MPLILEFCSLCCLLVYPLNPLGEIVLVFGQEAGIRDMLVGHGIFFKMFAWDKLHGDCIVACDCAVICA